MTKKILFASRSFPHAAQLLKEELKESFDVDALDPNKELCKQVEDVQVIIPVMSEIDKKVIEAAPALQVIAQFGVGLEGVDEKTAHKWGVEVHNVGGENATSVAECSLFLMLSLARQIKKMKRSFESGRIGTPIGNELQGKNLLIVGLGSCGSKLAYLANSIGMNCNGVRKHPEKGAPNCIEKLGEPEMLSELLPLADYVSLHLPLTEETKGFFNQNKFDMMKESSYLVNLSRGPIIVKEDLYNALTSREIAGAGLDVFWTEPPEPSDKLYDLPNVVTTPHIGGVTKEACQRIAEKLAEIIRKSVL